MSSAQPYESFHRAGGSTVFEADLPSLIGIGRRFDELARAYHGFRYSREHVSAEQAFVAAIEEARARAAAGQSSWGELVADLEGRFGEKFRRLRLGIPGLFLKSAEASPVGAAKVFEMLVTSARSTLARVAGDSDALDDPAVRAAAEWQPELPVNLLESSGIGEPLEAFKAINPVVGGQIASVLANLAGRLGGGPPDADRLKGLAQSPQGQQVFDDQRRAMEQLKGTNPEIAAVMRNQLDEMERMLADPAGFAADLTAGAEEDEAGDDEEESPLPPGRFRFHCGGVRRPTKHQKRLFDRLVKSQQELAANVERALRALHAEAAEDLSVGGPRERVLFPEDSSNSEVPLDYFRIESIILPESGDRIGISLESVYGHEEHGCALVIDGVEVVDSGGLDILLELEFDEDLGDADET